MIIILSVACVIMVRINDTWLLFSWNHGVLHGHLTGIIWHVR
jgi:hypothetical protein